MQLGGQCLDAKLSPLQQEISRATMFHLRQFAGKDKQCLDAKQNTTSVATQFTQIRSLKVALTVVLRDRSGIFFRSNAFFSKAGKPGLVPSSSATQNDNNITTLRRIHHRQRMLATRPLPARKEVRLDPIILNSNPSLGCVLSPPAGEEGGIIAAQTFLVSHHTHNCFHMSRLT